MTRRSLSAGQRILQLDCDSPLRQWVLSLPHALRFLLATDPDSLTRVLRTGYRAISGFLIQEGGNRELLHYARLLRVEKAMSPYLQAME